MSQWLLCVCVLFRLVLSGDCSSLYAGDRCVVDGDLPGSCKLLQECAPLLTEIQNAGHPMPARLRRKLQKLSCGFQSDEPMVCCQAPFTNVDPPVTNPNWSHPGTDDGKGGSNTLLTPRPTSSNADSNNDRPNENNAWNPTPMTETSPWINKNGNRGSTTTEASGINNEIPTYVSVVSHKNIGLLPDVCGEIDSDRIWGGTRTRLSEMPWMVLIAYDSPKGPKLSCGGTLITERYVLTAAHCVKFLGNRLTLSGVVLGDHDVRTDPDCERVEGEPICAPNSRNVTIEQVIAHPGYGPKNLYDDIALLRMVEPADFTLENMMPICLPTTPELQTESLTGKMGIVAGWGATEDGLQSPVLLNVALPIVGNKECQDAYNGSPKIRNTQLCAGGVPDKDSCGGDSGGPLTYPGRTLKGTKYVQRGIVSYGSKRCGIGGYPGVYTNVAKYIDWILDNIRS